MLNKLQSRLYYKQIRADIDKNLKIKYDEQICKNVIESPLFEKSDLIMLYYPLRGEIDTTLIFEKALHCGKQVCYPKCDKQSKTMCFFTVCGKDCFEKGAYGICEPIGGNKILPSEYNHALCIVPCLSCDDYGTRLGYGAGYYDRFFAQNSAIGAKIALCYEQCRTVKLQSDEYDVAVDFIATQNSLTEAKNEQ